MNRRPRPYQGRALPTELPGRENVDRTPSRRVLALRSSAVREVRLRRSSLRSRRSGARLTFSRASPAFRRRRHPRAGDGNRTRDVQLGRLMLYQLSYSRVRWDTDRGASRRVLAHRSSAYRKEHGCGALRFARDDLPHPPRSADAEPLRPRAQSRRPESNRRPADYKSAALPSELRRPAGSSPPANVVVCCSTGFRFRHPCYGERLSPVRCLSFGAEADVFEQAISWLPGTGPDTASQVRGSERKNALRKPPFQVCDGEIAKQHGYHRDRAVSIR